MRADDAKDVVDVADVVDEIVRTIPRWARLLGQELEGLEPSLSLRQFLVLQRIDDGTSRTVDLARTVRVTSPTMTRVIDRLVDMSLVTRDADPSDRRAIRLALTVEGRQVLERHERLLAGRVREVLVQDGEATQDELAGVRAACRVLSRAMDARKERVHREAEAPKE